jgi:histidine triad (HIT) family protein
VAVMALAHKLAHAALAALEMPGLNLLQSNGRSANQLVDHFHVHLIPQGPEDSFTHMHWNPIPGDMAEIDYTAVKIKDNF